MAAAHHPRPLFRPTRPSLMRPVPIAMGPPLPAHLGFDRQLVLNPVDPRIVRRQPEGPCCWATTPERPSRPTTVPISWPQRYIRGKASKICSTLPWRAAYQPAEVQEATSLPQRAVPLPCQGLHLPNLPKRLQVSQIIRRAII